MKRRLLFLFASFLISLTTFAQVVANQPDDLVVCDDNLDQFYDWDLSVQDATILGGQDPTTFQVTYHVTQQDAATLQNALASPYTNTTNPETIYAAVSDLTTGVSATTSFDLIVNTLPIATFGVDMVACSDGQPGFATFDLTLNEPDITQGVTGLSIMYYEDLNDAFNNINAITNPTAYQNIIAYSQQIYLRITDVNTGCFYVNSNTVLYLNVEDVPIIDTPTPLVACDEDGDGFASFDLNSKIDEIVGPANNYAVTFYETQADADNGTNALNSPYTNIVVAPQTIFVRVGSLFGNCYTITTLELQTETSCFTVYPATLTACDEFGNGSAAFDLNTASQEILGNLNPTDYILSYFSNEADALSNINPLPPTYNNISNPEIITVKVVGPTGDIQLTTITLEVIDLPTIGFDPSYDICDGDIVTLVVGAQTTGVYTATWSLDGIVLPGETSFALTVNSPGVYSVTVIEENSGCTITASSVVTVGNSVNLVPPSDLIDCDVNATGTVFFDLTSQNATVLAGLDPTMYPISFYLSEQDALTPQNPIANASNFEVFNTQTIFMRVDNPSGTCPSIFEFQLNIEACPTSIDCATGPVNTTFCYENNDSTQFTFTSSDGSPLQVVFNSGSTENNFDEVIILDSDGVTDLNIQTPYGNSGDLTGLTYISTGDTITIGVISDGSVIGCTSSSWDFDVSCVDTTVVPDCTLLNSPLDTAINVNENTTITWNNATGVVVGYKVTMGTTSGGTDVANALDVGNVLSYTPPTLASNTTYYVSIIPYNANGDAVGCSEESFTTRTIPSPPVGVSCGAEPSAYIFTEDFETDTPSGWTGTAFTGNNGEWDVTPGDANSSDTGPSTSFSGNSHLEYEASGNSSTIATAISPAIDLTNALTAIELSFYMHAYGADIGTLNVGVSNSATGPFTNAFTWAGEYQATDTEAWLPIGVNLDAYLGQVIYIEISYGATGNGYKGDLAIDFLRVQTCGSFCITPSNITVTNITDYTADISWTPNGTDTTWEYVIQPAGTGEPTGVGIVTNSIPVVATGLNPNTDYEVCVRADCGIDGFSNWACLDSFTTLPQTNFTVDCAANQPANVTYCYENNDTTQYTFTSSDSSPLLIVFNAGQVENTWDELVVLDSDGVTDLNASTPYGNDGDLTGLQFVTTGDSVTIYVTSDGSISCETNNYTSIDFDVFCASNVGFIEVNAFLDIDNDGIFNNNDTPFNNGFFTYEVNDDTNINTVNSTTGSFTITNQDDANFYDITFATNPGYENCYSIPTALFENVTVTAGNTTVVDFPVTEIMQCEDVAVYLVPSIPPRPGFLYWNNVVIENLGSTTVTSGSIEFVHDPEVTFVEVWNPPATGTITLTATGFIYDFVNLLPGQTITMYADMTVPATTPLGTMLTNSVTYLTTTNDVVVDNNASSVTQEVIGSYDPNDIMESYGPEIVYDDFIQTNEYLYYTIRFQNVGTAEAINVRIENTLNPLLDSNTMQMLESSHDVVMHRLGNQLTWTFDNINLPAEVQDERGSNGFVVYKIKPVAGYNIGTVIPNTAEIYFDFNAPVITNTFNSTFVEPQLSIDEFGIGGFSLYPNPASAEVTIRFNNALRGSFALTVIDLQGKQVLSSTVNADVTNTFNVSGLESGMYFVKLKNSKTEHIQKLIVK